MPYLIAHACFDCRRSLKIPPHDGAKVKCPHCRGTLHLMGRSFKAPSMDDVEQWAKVRKLFDAGFRFFSYRGTNAPPLPRKLADVESFVRENPSHPLRICLPTDTSNGEPGRYVSMPPLRVTRSGRQLRNMRARPAAKG